MQEAPGRLRVNVRLADQALRVGRGLVTRLDPGDGIFVVERANRELLETLRVDAVVLPVPVAAENEHVFDLLPGEPSEKGIRLGAEALGIRVVVLLARPVGTDHRGGGDDDLPSCVAFLQGLFQPGPLLGTPHRLCCAVRQFVVRAIIAPLEEPELHILADAVGAVVGGVRISGRMDGHLLAEQIHARGGRRQLVAALVGIVEAEVMVVLQPVSRRRAEEVDQAREAELLVPFLAHLRRRLCRGLQREAVVNDIARPNKEVGFEFLHRREGGIAELLVLFTRCYRPTTVRDASGECQVVHAASDRKGNALGFGIEGLE